MTLASTAASTGDFLIKKVLVNQANSPCTGAASSTYPPAPKLLSGLGHKIVCTYGGRLEHKEIISCLQAKYFLASNKEKVPKEVGVVKLK